MANGAFATVQVLGDGPGTLLVAAGDGPTLIMNQDTVGGTIVVSDNTSVDPLDSSNVVPIIPPGFMVVDGKRDVYGKANTAGAVVTINLVPGGLSFFQPVSQLIVSGTKAGLFVYSGTPALGDLAISIAANSGTDKYGNQFPAGLMVNSQELIYSSPVGFNRLIASNSNAGGTDAYGNVFLPGIVSYAPFAVTPLAIQIYNGILTMYTATNEAGPWTPQTQLEYTPSDGNTHFFGGSGGGEIILGAAAQAPSVPGVVSTTAMDVFGLLTLASTRTAMAGTNNTETQGVNFGSTVATTSGTGTIAIATGLTSVRAFVAWNGDAAARPNMVIGNNRGGWPGNPANTSVGITCFTGNTGATINSTSVRVDWAAIGVV